MNVGQLFGLHRSGVVSYLKGARRSTAEIFDAKRAISPGTFQCGPNKKNAVSKKHRTACQAIPSGGGLPPAPPPSAPAVAEGDEDDRRSDSLPLGRYFAAALLGIAALHFLIEAWENSASWVEDTADASVSVIIPALNEEAGIAKTVTYLKALDPPPLEVLVVDGGSVDKTCTEAERAGARVVKAGKGRAVQMNAGARVAQGSILCFLHADSQPPETLVPAVRRALADGRTVLGGFRVVIKHRDRTLQWLTFHQLVKTYYAPALFRPLSFSRGLRAMFGDQTLFCRARDFGAVQGFDERLRIMEDLDLVIRLHNAGPSLNPRELGSENRQPGRGEEPSPLQNAPAFGKPESRRPAFELGAVRMSDEEKLKSDLASRPRVDIALEPDLQFGQAVRDIQNASLASGSGRRLHGETKSRNEHEQPAQAAQDDTLSAEGQKLKEPEKRKRGRLGWRAGSKCRGRIKVLLNPPAVTSGRRLAAWGNLRATWIHLRLSTHWYFGGSPEGLSRLYEKLYTDAYR